MQELVPPRDDLPYAENFLWMTFGEVPDPVVVDAFRVSLILYAEHSFNASTFTARVITSTLADLYSAVVGAIGALKGALHGGANEAVMLMFEEIGTAAGAAPWLDAALESKRKVMGFGHRVYKHGDSRVPTMEASLDTLVDHVGRQDLGELYDALKVLMLARKDIRPEPRLPLGPGVPPHGLRHRDVHAAVRREPADGLDGAHHGAARVERADPAAGRVRRARRAAPGGLRPISPGRVGHGTAC